MPQSQTMEYFFSYFYSIFFAVFIYFFTSGKQGLVILEKVFLSDHCLTTKLNRFCFFFLGGEGEIVTG